MAQSVFVKSQKKYLTKCKKELKTCKNAERKEFLKYEIYHTKRDLELAKQFG